MSYHNREGEWKTLTNLGWLLRNDEIVESFEVLPIKTKFFRGVELPYANENHWDCWLIARCGNFMYVTEFADRTVLKDWLVRPKFSGLPIRWFGVRTIIPDTKRGW